MSRTTLRALPFCAILATMAPVGASAEIAVDEEEFRDWIHRCEFNTETSEINCFIYTGRVADYEGEELASRIVVILTHTGEPIVYLDVPDRAEPADGFVLQIDQQPPFSGRFSDCSTGWCHTQAVGEVAAQLISQFRAGAQAKVSFVLDEAGVQIDLPLSLLGFTASFTKLQEVHAELVQALIEQQEEAAAAAAEAEAAAEEDDGAAAADGDEGAAAAEGEGAAADGDAAPEADDAAAEAADAPADGEAGSEEPPADDAAEGAPNVEDEPATEN